MMYRTCIAQDRSGASAVEFAILAPLFLVVLFTMTAYGIYFGAALSVEQIAADAARYSVAGLTTDERSTLAREYVSQATFDNPLIDRQNLKVDVEADPEAPDQFVVSVSYDADKLPIWDLFSFPLPSRQIRRFATIRIGGV